MRTLADINPYSVHSLYFDAKFRVLKTTYVPLQDPQLSESECWTFYMDSNHIECHLDPDSVYNSAEVRGIPIPHFVSLDIVKRRGSVFLCRLDSVARGPHDFIKNSVVLWERD